MRRSPFLLTAATLTFAATGALAQLIPPGDGGDGDVDPDQVTLRWPSDEHPTLQSAIDALPSEGGVLRIARGRYRVPEPLFVRSKNVVIKGAGCGAEPAQEVREAIAPLIADGDIHEDTIRYLDRLSGPRGTHLIGPRPSRVVDFDESIALLNFVDAGGVLSNVRISGHDAGISGIADDASGVAGPGLSIENTCIDNTIRGITWATSSPLSIEGATLLNARWNGLSVRSLSDAPLIRIFNLIALNSRNACMVFIGAYAYPGRVQCINNGTGGGILALNSAVLVQGPGGIVNSDGPGIAARQSGFLLRGPFLVKNSTGFGVYFDEPHYSEIRNINLTNTQAFVNGPQAGLFGDGVMVSGRGTSWVNVDSSSLSDSARSGLANFGAQVSMENVRLICAAFELLGEPYLSNNFQFTDRGGSRCGCPLATQKCVAVSAGLASPDRPPVRP